VQLSQASRLYKFTVGAQRLVLHTQRLAHTLRSLPMLFLWHLTPLLLLLLLLLL
jgi:hypothetical protein